MWVDILFSLLFVMGVYYLIRYRLNLKKAAELADDALFPKEKSEFASVLISTEWKEMEPLSKKTKSYKYVHWGTIGALVLLTILLIIVYRTDWFSSSFFSLVYFFLVIISAIPHKGNFFLLSNGLILYGRYYHYKQVESYNIEQIVRWHELYGLSDRVNNGFKLSIKLKRPFFKNNLVVVEDRETLDKIVAMLQNHGIKEQKD